MSAILRYWELNRWIIAIFIAILALTASVEIWMGRSLLGPDGRFGLWEGNIWSSETSQRFADPYSFSHLIHGISFYAVLWLFVRKLPIRVRLLLALLLEGGWEILENSPFIIQRYREATISLGYDGDSVLNSLSDILMVTLGFLFAYRVPVKVSVVAVVLMEIGCALWVRDNLTLNIIMLIHPIEAVKHWQMAGAPGG